MKINKKSLLRILIASCGLVLITVLTLCLVFCGKNNGGEGENQGQNNPNATTHFLNGKEIHVDIAYKLETLENVTVLSNAEPTCSEFGKGFFTCDCCNATQLILINTIPHTFQTKVVTPPTCTEVGKEVTACINCSEKTEKELPATGHDYFYDVTDNSDGTFTLNGKCDCGDEQNNITAIRKEFTKDSTCDEWGIISYYAEDGSVFEVKTDKKPHTLNGEYADLDKLYNVTTPGIEEIVNAPATCTGDGMGYFLCEVCSNTLMVKIFKNHEYDESTLVVETAPTCTASGLGHIYCTGCNESIEYTVPKINHVYDYSSYNASTKIFNGNCKFCDENLTFTVEKTNVEKQASCEEPGLVVYSNKDNTLSANAEIPKISHRIGGLEIKDGEAYDKNISGITEIAGKEATCTEEGIGYFTCDVCQKLYMVSTKLSHSFVEKTWYSTEGGVRYKNTGKECIHCGERIIDEKEAAE